jgi:methylmalonyl-CoA/ethylmalonyl-CoA epimerase
LNKKIVKMGIVVDNMEEAAQAYAKMFGLEVPPIKTQLPEQPYEYTWFGGRRSEKIRCKIAIISLEPIFIELFEPPTEPSPWAGHGQGVHFIAFNVNISDEQTRQRIINAAKRYINSSDPNTSHWLGSNIIYKPAMAGDFLPQK